jgi:hypothetical protein
MLNGPIFHKITKKTIIIKNVGRERKEKSVIDLKWGKLVTD